MINNMDVYIRQRWSTLVWGGKKTKTLLCSYKLYHNDNILYMTKHGKQIGNQIEVMFHIPESTGQS